MTAAHPTPRVALYARYSSDNQRDASIEDQLRQCRERAAREGWTVAESYSDRAISGASLIRSGIQSLLADAQAGRFDIVLSEALDRISRDQEDVAVRQSLFADGRAQPEGLRRRHFARVENLVAGGSRDVGHATVPASEPDEAIAALRRIQRFDLRRDPRLIGARSVPEQRVRDLLGAAHLSVEQRVFQIGPQLDIKERAQQDEDGGEQAGVPGRQPKAQGPRVHSDASSERQ